MVELLLEIEEIKVIPEALFIDYLNADRLDSIELVTIAGGTAGIEVSNEALNTQIAAIQSTTLNPISI